MTIWNIAPDGTVLSDDFVEATGWELPRGVIRFEAASFEEAWAFAQQNFGLVEDA